MSGHTPGPWRVEPSHDINGELFAIGTNYQWPEGSNAFVVLAFTAHKGIGPYAAHREADARLIAAAPELLDACKVGLDLLEHYGICQQVEVMRAAIAKAEGRS